MKKSTQQNPECSTEAISAGSTLWHLILLGRPPWLALLSGCLVLLLETGATLSYPVVARQVVDGLLTTTEGTGKSIASDTGLHALIALLLFAAVASGVWRLLLAKAGLRMAANLRIFLIEKVVNKPIKFFDDGETGDHVSKVLNDTSSIAQLLSESLPGLISGLILVTGTLTILGTIDVSMTMVILFASVAVFAVLLPAFRQISSVSIDTNMSNSRLTSHITQLFSNIRLVKSSSAEAFELRKSGVEISRFLRSASRGSLVVSIVHPVVTTAITSSLVIVLIYGGARVRGGSLSIGDLTAFIIYIFNVTAPLLQIAGFVTRLQQAKGSAYTLSNILRSPPESQWGRPLPLVKPLNVDSGDLVFSELEFSYGCGPIILKADHLTIKHGSQNVILGPSGSGKSTALALVQRFYRPTNGSILYNSQNIEEIPLLEWRKIIGVVSQNSQVMNGSIRENLCYGLSSSVNDDVLFKCADAANCTDFISRLDGGFDALIGENGIKLSGGQRQRLSIARLLVRDPKILLLDEATSNLDSDNTSKVLAALENVMEGRTVISVTHKTSTITGKDNVFVIENGTLCAI